VKSFIGLLYIYQCSPFGEDFEMPKLALTPSIVLWFQDRTQRWIHKWSSYGSYTNLKDKEPNQRVGVMWIALVAVTHEIVYFVIDRWQTLIFLVH
jgi:hypothetical protein